MRKIAIWVIGMSLILILLAGGIFYYRFNLKKVVEQPPIRIMVDPWPGNGLIFIAQEKGFFEQEGVNVNLSLGSYDTAINAYKNKEIDGFFLVYADLIFLFSEGFETKLVYVLDHSVGGDVIVSGQEINSLKDLRGKTIGISGVNSFSNLFLIKLMEKAGINEWEYFIKVVPVDKIVDSLKNKEIDAGHVWDPYKSQAVDQGYKVIGSSNETPFMIVEGFGISSEFISNRPEEVQKIVSALVRAKEFLDSNLEEGLEIMARRNNLSVSEVETGIKNSPLLSLKENSEVMQTTNSENSLYNSGRVITEFYMTRGQMSKMLDLNQLIEPKFINKILGEKI